MRFMNDWDIDDAVERYRQHPILSAATRTLANVRDAANENSDGWPYWPKPARAANKLMELIEGDRTSAYRFGERDVSKAELTAAYRPLKAFRTRSGIHFEIVEPT